MTNAKDLKPGNYIKINNEILKVTRKEIANCGTHCHSKTKLYVQGLYSKGEKTMNLNHQDSVDQIDITRKEGQVISKMPNKVQLMDQISFETLDADCDEELLSKVFEGDTVTFITFEGMSKVIEKRGV
ncbi:MAG TPA: hypothetical protein VFF28_05265 [Candidatus Nanoarchaeia archaeon]|nr:hypothetical protein [Candidatus Nanoarchaeia archaeon]